MSACQEQSNFCSQREPPGKETQVLATEVVSLCTSSENKTLSITCLLCLLQWDCVYQEPTARLGELCSRYQEDAAHLCVNSAYCSLSGKPFLQIWRPSKIPLQASWCMIGWASFVPAKREEQDKEVTALGYLRPFLVPQGH